MVCWNYRLHSRQSVFLRHGRYPKRLTTIGRGDFHHGYFQMNFLHNYQSLK
jgi:hypothetical protein